MSKQRKSNELIFFQNRPTGCSLGDYWAWNCSDLLSNTERGSFSEFLVSAALGIDLSGTRDKWSPYDIAFPYDWRCDGQSRHIVRVEVKSCAYLQSWEQRKLSHIIFSIRAARAWDPRGGYSTDIQRQSDVYVFCVYTKKERSEADPLILDDWSFYSVPTRKLNDICGPQKSISLSSLLKLKPIPSDYSGIRAAVISCLEGYSRSSSHTD